MKYLKSYKLFESVADDLKFEFLSSIPKVEQTILKVVSIHENHYYKDSKIVSDEDFINDIKDFSKRMLNNENIWEEDYLRLINEYQKKHYGKDEMNLDIYSSDIQGEESMFDLFQGLVGSFRYAVDLMKKGELDAEEVEEFKEESNDIFDRVDDSWVYKMNAEEQKENMKRMKEEWEEDERRWEEEKKNKKDEEEDFPWETDDDFVKDVEKHIGKPIDNFDYHDKLEMIDYVRNTLASYGVTKDVIDDIIKRLDIL